jgi:hypothetical protein
MLSWTNRFAAVAVLGVALAGCNSGGDFKAVKDLPKAAHDDHGHSHGEHAHGPHGGELVELGKEEFHAEFVVDGKAHTLKVFLLGPDAKTAATTDASELSIVPEGGTPIILKAAEGQPEGKVSEFALTDEKIVHDLNEAGFIHGDLKVKIGGTPYNGHLDAHFDEDHDHGKEEMKKDDKASDSPTLIEPEKPAETPADPK